MPSTMSRGTFTTVAALACLASVAPACGGDDPSTADSAPDAAADVPEAPPAPPPEARSDGGSSYVPIDVDCPIGAAVELEPNDEPAAATDLDDRVSMCGAISPGEDVDYSRFTTPSGKRLALFQAVIDGKVDFDLLVNGKTLRPSDVRDFEAGEYLVKAFTTDGKPGRYRYRIQFEP